MLKTSSWLAWPNRNGQLRFQGLISLDLPAKYLQLKTLHSFCDNTLKLGLN